MKPFRIALPVLVAEPGPRRHPPAHAIHEPVNVSAQSRVHLIQRTRCAALHVQARIAEVHQVGYMISGVQRFSLE